MYYLRKHLIILSVITLLFNINPVNAEKIIQTDIPGLVDENGQPVTIGSYDGLYRLVFFGYTQCPDICPLTMYYVSSALKSLGEDAGSIRVLFISIDPGRDTPAVLAQYTDAFHPLIIGITGSYESIMLATSKFRTTFGYTIVEGETEKSLTREEYESLPAGAEYIPYHSSQIYLLDKNGGLLDIIGYGSTAGDIENRIRENFNIDKQIDADGRQ